jgi:pimeloyl-ACP methyl ester carboxylesterase
MLAQHVTTGSAAPRRYVRIGRTRFGYFAWGDHGSPVVLVHGTGFHGYVWQPVARALSRTHRVFALDQRGHGDSPKPRLGYTWTVFGNDLHKFLSALSLTSVAAVGHSAGATAIAFCAAAHPGLIRRAVLIDPILFAGSEAYGGENPLAHRARKRRMVWESRPSMFHSYRARPPFNTWREDVLWAYLEEGTVVRPDGQVELKCPGVIEAQIFEHAPKSDGFGVLPKLTLPVLLLRGESSEAFGESSAAQALSLLPHGQLKTIARTTHFIPMERPDAVERAIRTFLSP